LKLKKLLLFRASIDAGAETIMVNSGSINGIPVHASYEILTTILREELGFKVFFAFVFFEFKNLI